MSDTILGSNPSPEPAKPAGYCRTCGKALAQNEFRISDGVIYCAEHAPPPIPSARRVPDPMEPVSPWADPVADPAPRRENVSPGLAFLLGLIPGVGAIYNGQYAKGLVHVIIFGLLTSIMKSGAGEMEPLFGMLTAAWYLYMPFEAYHTAKKRQRGELADEFSGLFTVRRRRASSNIGAVVLIVSGVLFLMINFEVVRLYEIARFWPVLLIVAGVHMLYSRMSQSRKNTASDEEFYRGGI